MATVTAEVALPASAAQVWSVLSDPSRFEDWLTIHAGWLGEVPAELSAGIKLSEKVILLGMANKVDWTIEEFSAPQPDAPEAASLVKLSGTGMAGVRVGFSLAVRPNGDASTASVDAEFSGQMIVGALGKAVEKEALKNLDESMAKLASIVTTEVESTDG